MKEGRPIPIRFTDAVEKRLRIYAIENDMNLSEVIRRAVGLGLEQMEAPVSAAPATQRRRVLSKGVV